MLALRLASAKLNVAQRKTPGLARPSQTLFGTNTKSDKWSNHENTLPNSIKTRFAVTALDGRRLSVSARAQDARIAADQSGLPRRQGQSDSRCEHRREVAAIDGEAFLAMTRTKKRSRR